MRHASGSFDVKVVPVEPSSAEAGGFGHMTFEKTISGGLNGTSQGEMLTSTTPSTGAMAYVAVETVTATLDGRSGTFAFIHSATMKKSDPGSQSLHISVVPASGTGGLAGISGDFVIHLDAAGKHTYDFEYFLP